MYCRTALCAFQMCRSCHVARRPWLSLWLQTHSKPQTSKGPWQSLHQSARAQRSVTLSREVGWRRCRKPHILQSSVTSANSPALLASLTHKRRHSLVCLVDRCVCCYCIVVAQMGSSLSESPLFVHSLMMGEASVGGWSCWRLGEEGKATCRGGYKSNLPPLIHS